MEPFRSTAFRKLARGSKLLHGVGPSVQVVEPFERAFETFRPALPGSNSLTDEASESDAVSESLLELDASLRHGPPVTPPPAKRPRSPR